MDLCIAQYEGDVLCPSVYHSHIDLLLRNDRLTQRTLCDSPDFSDAKNLDEIPTGSTVNPNRGAKYRW